MKLKEYLQKNNIKMMQLSKILGVSYGTINGLCNENRLPSKDLALKIFEWSNGEVNFEGKIKNPPRNIVTCPTCGRGRRVKPHE